MEPAANALERFFAGRTRRTAFLMCMLFWTVVGFVLALAAVFISWPYDIFPPDRKFVTFTEVFVSVVRTFNFFSFVIYAAITIPCARVTVRRLHDMGASGWWALPMFASALVDLVAAAPNLDELWGSSPGLEASLAQSVRDSGIPQAVLIIGFLACLFWPGTKGANRFGPNPRTLASE